jgi:malonyl-CoA O-methyltransferase
MTESSYASASDLDPHINPIAAARWAEMSAPSVPWLHGEVGRRMAERLDYIKLATKDGANWSWQRGGEGPWQAQSERLGARWVSGLERLFKPLGLSFSKPSSFKLPADLSQDMVWSNMQLHMEAAPKRVIEAWHAALKTDGFVMFSLLGPDTLIELRAAYQRRGWTAPLHTLTDMHDWGDRLVQHGFAEPVMDMERLTLTFGTPERALQELRELGRNLNPARVNKSDAPQGLMGKAWRIELLAALEECRNSDDQIALTFELIYGHAIKPKPRVKLSSSASVSLSHMREMLRR